MCRSRCCKIQKQGCAALCCALSLLSHRSRGVENGDDDSEAAVTHNVGIPHLYQFRALLSAPPMICGWKDHTHTHTHTHTRAASSDWRVAAPQRTYLGRSVTHTYTQTHIHTVQRRLFANSFSSSINLILSRTNSSTHIEILKLQKTIAMQHVLSENRTGDISAREKGRKTRRTGHMTTRNCKPAPAINRRKGYNKRRERKGSSTSQKEEAKRIG